MTPVNAANTPQGGRVPPEQERRGKECPGKEVAGGDPELRREVCIIAGKDSHPLIGKGVDQPNSGNEEETGAGDEQVTVPPHRPGVPGDGEDRYRYSDGDKFGDRRAGEHVPGGGDHGPHVGADIAGGQFQRRGRKRRTLHAFRGRRRRGRRCATPSQQQDAGHQWYPSQNSVHARFLS